MKQNQNHGIGKNEIKPMNKNMHHEQDAVTKREKPREQEQEEKKRSSHTKGSIPREFWELSDTVLGKKNPQKIRDGYSSPFTPM